MTKLFELITGDYFKLIKLVIDCCFLTLGIFFFLRLDEIADEVHRLNRTSWEISQRIKEDRHVQSVQHDAPRPVIKKHRRKK